jgi:hypothetical protein
MIYTYQLLCRKHLTSLTFNADEKIGDEIVNRLQETHRLRCKNPIQIVTSVEEFLKES